MQIRETEKYVRHYPYHTRISIGSLLRIYCFAVSLLWHEIMDPEHLLSNYFKWIWHILRSFGNCYLSFRWFLIKPKCLIPRSTMNHPQWLNGSCTHTHTHAYSPIQSHELCKKFLRLAMKLLFCLSRIVFNASCNSTRNSLAQSLLLCLSQLSFPRINIVSVGRIEWVAAVVVSFSIFLFFYSAASNWPMKYRFSRCVRLGITLSFYVAIQFRRFSSSCNGKCVGCLHRNSRQR